MPSILTAKQLSSRFCSVGTAHPVVNAGAQESQRSSSGGRIEAVGQRAAGRERVRLDAVSIGVSVRDFEAALREMATHSRTGPTAKTHQIGPPNWTQIRRTIHRS